MTSIHSQLITGRFRFEETAPSQILKELINTR